MLCTNKLEDFFLASRTACAVDDLAVLHYDERRNADYTEFSCKLGVIVYVDLAYQEVISLCGNLVYKGKHHTAGAAPICIEISLIATTPFYVEFVFLFALTLIFYTKVAIKSRCFYISSVNRKLFT